METFSYKPAITDELDRLWRKNIAAHHGDERWVKWRAGVIMGNILGSGKTFVVLYNGEPVGEGTLIFDMHEEPIQGRADLADGATVANINALRIEKQFEGQGHISRLVKVMEQYASEQGYKRLTIGVEPNATRNLAIYLHWGYNTLVRYDVERDGLILYYSKNIGE